VVLPTERERNYIEDSNGTAHIADSKEEVWIAEAFRDYGIGFEYQYQIGSPGSRGSLVVDFVVYVAPRTALEYFGPYWHEGWLGAQDLLKIARLHRLFKRVVVWTVKEVWDAESAKKMVRRTFI